MRTTTPTSGDCRPTRPTSPTVSPDPFVLTLWTRDADVARAADAAGVQRIGVDLEHLGKAERQAGRGTWLSPHSVDDLSTVAEALSHALPFVRVNPLHEGTARELERVLALGARVVMAPMIASAADAADFAGHIAGRACLVALIERKEAVARLDEIACVPGVDEIHVGLNDLSISLGLPNRWTLLTGNLMMDASRCAGAAGRPFGFGGVGRALDDRLPIPADLIYAEYARTGATRALVARSFAVDDTPWATLVPQALTRLAHWRAATPEALAEAHAELGRRVRASGAW